MEDLYGRAYDFAHPTKTRSSYMLATLPRSGSTFVSVTLWREGVFGAPLEYLNYISFGKVLKREGIKVDDKYWDDLLKRRTSPNGVFGFKMFAQDYSKVLRTQPDLIPRIESDYTIYLTRRDKEAQALSYSRAIQTGSWFSSSQEERDFVYDPVHLQKCRDSLDRQEEGWERVFQLTSVTPMRLYYEEFTARTEFTLDLLALYMNIQRIDEAFRLTHVPLPEVQRSLKSESEPAITR